MLAWFIRESEAVYKKSGRDSPQRSLTYWITARGRQHVCNCRYRDAKSTGNMCLRSPHKLKFAGSPDDG